MKKEQNKARLKLTYKIKMFGIPGGNVPRTMEYGMKQAAVSSRIVRRAIAPMNSTSYTSGSNAPIQIEIQATPRQYIDWSKSYLKFKYTNTAATVHTLAYGPGGLIERVRVQNGSNLIVDIDNYNHMFAMLSQTMCGEDNACSTRSALEGINYLYGVTAVSSAITPAFTAEAAAPTALRAAIQAADSGTYVGDINARFATTTPTITLTQSPSSVLFENESIAAAGSRYFVHQLVGGCFNLLPYYFPLSFMKSSLRIDLTIADANQAVILDATAAADATFTLTEIELILFCIEVDPVVDDAIKSRLGPLCILSSEDYTGFIGSVAAGTSAANVNIPCTSLKSLKGVYLLQQLDSQTSLANNHGAHTGAGYQQTIGSYIKATLSEFWFDHNGVRMPCRPIKAATTGKAWVESYAEFMNCLMALSAPTTPVGIASSNYARDTHETLGDPQAFFVVGYGTESFGSKTDSILSGMDISGGRNFQWVASYTGALAAALRILGWCHHDVAYHLNMIDGSIMRYM